jgi:hypothetical protein
MGSVSCFLLVVFFLNLEGKEVKGIKGGLRGVTEFANQERR